MTDDELREKIARWLFGRTILPTLWDHPSCAAERQDAEEGADELIALLGLDQPE